MKLYISFFVTIITAHAVLMGAEKPESYRDRIGTYFERARGEKPTKTRKAATPAMDTKKPETPKIAPIAPAATTPAEAKKELAKPITLPKYDCRRVCVDLGCDLKWQRMCEEWKPKPQSAKDTELRKYGVRPLSNDPSWRQITRCATAALICAGADPNANHDNATGLKNVLMNDYKHAKLAFEHGLKTEDHYYKKGHGTIWVFVETVAMAELLLQYGSILPKHIGTYGSLLHHAASVKRPALVKFYLDQGIDSNDMSNSAKDTPLHDIAHHCGIHDIASTKAKAQYLLDADADPTIQNSYGKTARDIAEIYYRKDNSTCKELADMLRKAELEKNKGKK